MACMRASVGEGGANTIGDVKYVQFLLCDRRLIDHKNALEVDGIAGPLTKAAIREFQKQHRTGMVDGRVDVNGPTIRALEGLHIDKLSSGMTASLSKYRRAINEPIPGPLSGDKIADRYLHTLRSALG